ALEENERVAHRNRRPPLRALQRHPVALDADEARVGFLEAREPLEDARPEPRRLFRGHRPFRKGGAAAELEPLGQSQAAARGGGPAARSLRELELLEETLLLADPERAGEVFV